MPMALYVAAAEAAGRAGWLYVPRPSAPEACRQTGRRRAFADRPVGQISLEATYPAEGWGAFLGRDDQNGTPEFKDADWDAIVISGHSQGAGHGMVIAKKDTVAKICGSCRGSGIGRPRSCPLRDRSSPAGEATSARVGIGRVGGSARLRAL